MSPERREIGRKGDLREKGIQEAKVGEIPKDSVLLPVPVAVLKHGDRHNVREKGSLLIYSTHSTVGTERRRQGLKQLLTPHPHPGSREW